MINLSNLKANKTVTVGEVKVTKLGDGYELNVANEVGGKISYRKEDKVWMLEAGGAVHILQDATAKTAVDKALELVTYVAPTEIAVVEPEVPAEPEIVEPEVEVVEAAETVREDVDTTGGLGRHRAAVYATLAQAYGATATLELGEGKGYKRQTTIVIAGDEGVPAKVIDAAHQVLAKALELGTPLSREASRGTRLAGIHHSAGGFYARAGLLRGLALGVAKLINKADEDEWLDLDGWGHGKIDDEAYQLGQVMAGQVALTA